VGQYSRLVILPFILLFLGAAQLAAITHSGSVRAADQFVPGAMITATQGEKKVVAYTDEKGRYMMDLDAGVWDIKVEMFGFTTVHSQLTISPGSYRDWTIEMPRLGEKPGDEAKSASDAGSAKPANTTTAGNGRGGGRGGDRPNFRNRPPGAGGGPGRGGPGGPGGPGRGFQNAEVRATPEGQQAVAAAADPLAPPTDPTLAGDADETYAIVGSTSGGLAQSSDDEGRRQRMMGGGPPGGGPGGPGGAFGPGGGAALGTPPGMIANDNLGLGGFGAAGINGGFAAGPGGQGGPGFGGGGPGGGPGGFGGGGGPGGGGFGGGGGGRGGGGGGGRGGGGGGQNNNRRGPYNGQYASFGNRRRNQPAYSGSIFINSFQNSYLNAAPYSLNGEKINKPSYDKAQFGFTIGGPMVIPKLLNWKRANFNVTYQGLLSRNPFNQVSSVPTVSEREGDFSGLVVNNKPVTIFDPLSNAPFPNNVIPPTRINSAAAGLLPYFPLPTYSGLIQNFSNSSSTPNNNQNIGVRLNAPLNNKDRLIFNIQYQDRNSQTEQLFGFRDDGTGYGLSSAVGWSHSFGRRFNNSATVTFSRNITKLDPFFADGENIAAELGITGTLQTPIAYGPPTISFTNFGSLSDANPSTNRAQTTNFTDNITYVYKRKHNLTFGYLFRRLQNNNTNYSNARGSFSFSGLVTSEIVNGQPVSGTGYDFADFLLGLPQSSSVRYGTNSLYFRGWATSGFANDDFRISRGTSINFGIRYEYFSPYTEKYNRLSNLDLNATDTAVAVVTPGENAPYSGQLPTSLVRSQDKNFSPRFGFAFRPWAKKSTVFRGGYSIFYSGSAYSQIASQLASQPPFATTVSSTTSTALPLTLQNGFIASPSVNITNTYSINPDYRIAYAQTWSFAIQNTLPHGFLVETEYIGTKGTHLGVVEQPNRAAPGTSVVNAGNQLPIPYASAFTYQTSDANSIFNAGQVRITRRFQRGVSGVLLYTFSKSLDNASSFSGPGGTTVQFINNLQLERGLSSFNQTHRISGTFLLSSPVGVHGMLRNGGWKQHALAGWTINGTLTAASGTPQTATVSGNLSNIGGNAAFGSSRAEATGESIDTVAGGNPYFNLGAFTIPPAGFYGNAGRDTIINPFTFGLNMALNRAFRFGDTRRTLQFRLSATNALNHVDITSVGTTVNASNYGLPTAASATRTVTLLLRFSF
jgi:trimeric autotransporter adhesin